MDIDPPPPSLYMLRRAMERSIDWTALYRLAIAAGHGQIVSPEEQHLAGVDELLAQTISRFVRLGELSSYASFTPLAHACTPGLANATASILCVLDCALAAHGRDTGYSIDVWRADIALRGSVSRGMLKHERL